MMPLVPFKRLSSFMGCGVSKFDAEEETNSHHKFRHVIRPRNNGAVVDISMFPDQGDCKGEEYCNINIHHHQQQQQMKVMMKKKLNSLPKGTIPGEMDNNMDNEEGDHGHDSIVCPASPSFREYCIFSDDHSDIDDGNSSEGKIKDKKLGVVRNGKKGPRTRSRKRGGSIGKGLRTGSAKVKSILRV